MKKITGLDKPIVVIPTSDIDKDLKIPTMKTVILNCITTTRNITGEKTIRLTKLGLDLMGAKETLDVEDADFDILKEVMKSGTPYPSFLTGQIMMLLDQAEKQPEVKKP